MINSQELHIQANHIFCSIIIKRNNKVLTKMANFMGYGLQVIKKVKKRKSFKDGEFNGIQKKWYENGKQMLESNWRNGEGWTISIMA